MANGRSGACFHLAPKSAKRRHESPCPGDVHGIPSVPGVALDVLLGLPGHGHRLQRIGDARSALAPIGYLRVFACGGLPSIIQEFCQPGVLWYDSPSGLALVLLCPYEGGRNMLHKHRSSLPWLKAAPPPAHVLEFLLPPGLLSSVALLPGAPCQPFFMVKCPRLKLVSLVPFHQFGRTKHHKQ